MSTEAAVERVRALAQSWVSLPGDDMSTSADRRVGAWLLGILDGEPEQALEGARILAEGWEKPGGGGLFYPAAGQAVLDAIRGASIEEEAGWRMRAERAEARLAAIADHCRQRMNSPGRSGLTGAAAGIILGIAEGSSEETCP